MMAIQTKRWDDPREHGDGWRILICRYRPRGLAKSDETWDEWLPDLGPSKSLHAAAYGKGRDAIPWPQYRAAYLKEMLSQKSLIQDLVARVREGQSITLLCSSSCTRESRCHRSLLKALIETELGAAAPA